MNQQNNTTIDFAIKQDKDDVLKDFRKQFFIVDENCIYLDGNSLGRLPIKTKTLISNVVEKQWGSNLIESWNEPLVYVRGRRTGTGQFPVCRRCGRPS